MGICFNLLHQNNRSCLNWTNLLISPGNVSRLSQLARSRENKFDNSPISLGNCLSLRQSERSSDCRCTSCLTDLGSTQKSFPDKSRCLRWINLPVLVGTSFIPTLASLNTLKCGENLNSFVN
uniref:Uncharacterized protein n=1 Tax=Opuntia streptacantha TaxID=393608 RepID=A0A7C9E9C4_OPUST